MALPELRCFDNMDDYPDGTTMRTEYFNEGEEEYMQIIAVESEQVMVLRLASSTAPIGTRKFFPNKETN
jgi:hypothetical protein